MKTEQNQRVRKVNVENLSDEQLRVIEGKLVEKISPIVAKAIEDANKFLNPYGLKAAMSFEIHENQAE